MARRVGLGVVLILVLAVALAVLRPWRHAGSTRTEPPTFASLLQPYVLPAAATPTGFTQTSVEAWSNPSLAGSLQDPAAIHALLASQHVTQLRQNFAEADGGPATISVFLDLYLDSRGAQTAVTDQMVSPGTTVVKTAVPALGDVGAGSRISYSTPQGQRVDEETAGFASGRLGVRVSEAAPAGRVRQGEVLSLASRMAGIVARRHVPPPSAAEQRLVHDQTSPVSILHDAYRFLLTNYLTRLDPATVLRTALAGAITAVHRAPDLKEKLPVPTATDADGAWTQFLSTYRRLEQPPSGSDPRTLAYAAARGMYDALGNCHTVFYPPAPYARLLATRRGEAEARIGVKLTVHLPLIILGVEAGSPAQRAGLQAGDQIAAIDHTTPEQVGEKAFGELLHGDAGSTMVLTILRPGAAQPFDVSVVRELIPQTIEHHELLPGGIGYIELDNFVAGDEAAGRMRAALDDLQTSGNVTGWILDLRYNSGGIEATMQRIAGLFVPEGSRLVSITAQSGATTELQSIGTPYPEQPPLVLLTGAATASSAEMLTEALRDLGRATVVGETTNGCVNGGQIVGLLDGSGVIVSTQRVLAGPKQVALEGVGVTPDIAVQRTRADLVAGRDPQLDAAIGVLQRLNAAAAISSQR